MKTEFYVRKATITHETAVIDGEAFIILLDQPRERWAAMGKQGDRIEPLANCDTREQAESLCGHMRERMALLLAEQGEGTLQ